MERLKVVKESVSGRGGRPGTNSMPGMAKRYESLDFSPLELADARATGCGRSHFSSGSENLPLSLLNAQEAERKRISRELHDSVCQSLTEISLRVQRCVTHVERKAAEENLGDEWENLCSLPLLVREALAEVRNICMALRPSVLDDLGVLLAIQCHCRRLRETKPGFAIDTSFTVSEDQIPDKYKTAIFRVVQEALNNAVKYSNATRILITLHREGDELFLSIEDDGRGFDLTEVYAKGFPDQKGGLGLYSMPEWVEGLGGRFFIETDQNRGTAVSANWLLAG
ncbi:MAG: sensor histidine kinase [gamma proteobacterium endosymbiont of Lamellibrachia anaximandri]|nr:sensor histidine kinase [gamma proteobacterium endosymbiont of Lamellibrachia anaximandri]MBL3535640.1 sensor histidine kinase [gamma proteobacterium endosymbiont of Lamellibrachia anaximandri]